MQAKDTSFNAFFQI